MVQPNTHQIIISKGLEGLFLPRYSLKVQYIATPLLLITINNSLINLHSNDVAHLGPAISQHTCPFFEPAFEIESHFSLHFQFHHQLSNCFQSKKKHFVPAQVQILHYFHWPSYCFLQICIIVFTIYQRNIQYIWFFIGNFQFMHNCKTKK